MRPGPRVAVLKSINPLDLASTVRVVVEDTVYHHSAGLDGGRPSGAPDGVAPGPLTARERATLELVAEGRSNLDVARNLYVSEETVKFRLSNIYRKLGVGNRTAATRYAHTHHLIDF